jgi:hypothetical protein
MHRKIINVKATEELTLAFRKKRGSYVRTIGIK